MPFAICHFAELRTRRSAAASCVLAGLLFLLTSCPGNGGADGSFDSGSEETYAGSSSANASSSSSSGGSSTVTISFEDIMKYSNSGNVDELARRFADNSGGSGEELGSGGEAGTDVVALSASDIGLPDGGTVTLSITGGVEDYEETATASDDGMVYFLVPRQAVGSEITVGLVVKKADGTLVCSGKKTQVVKAGCQFSIALSSGEPVDFVQVGDIFMCVHEVTQGEYEQYCGYGGGLSPSATYGVGSNYPAYRVNWYDAILYCNLRSLSEGLTPCYLIFGSQVLNATTSGMTYGLGGKPCGPNSDDPNWNGVTYDPSANGYRLPTEAEWLAAADDGHTYSGSDDADEVAWHSGNSGTGGGPSSSGGKTHEVKGKQANSAGIYDMSGNVWEWCWDASSSYRVLRGGSWGIDASYCEVSYRNYGNPSSRDLSYGFRVVRKAD